jgi:undecaprenyl-diphosphatase
LGVHYPGDLLVGGLVGSIGSFLVYGLLVRYGRYTRPEETKLSYLPVWVGLITILGILVYATIKQ